MVRVFNLATREERFYFCHPFAAVVACYAQAERKDYSTWMYYKYWQMVDYTSHTYLLGDWCALVTELPQS